MKLKLLAGLVVFSLLFSSGVSFAASKVDIPSSFVYQAINKYKQKNYTGCIQDMEYIIKKGKPTDIAYYYQAISYSQLGMQDKAKTAYESAINLTSNSTLKDYATHAVSCIDDATLCDANLDNSDISKFIQSEKFMHSDVEAGLQKQSLERVQAEINADSKPSDDSLKYINQNNAPTDKEIADAVRTLSKLGINPLMANGGYNMYAQSPEMMQMSAFFGNKNNNAGNLMDLIPMISAMQGSGGGKTQINKDFVQAYMLNQMLPNFNFGNSDK